MKVQTRRDFIKTTALFTASAALASFPAVAMPVQNIGLQLYSVRKDMLADATGTLKKLAAIGYKNLESAGSEKGSYYGLKPKEMKKIASDLGMTVLSGHVHIGTDWQKTVDEAAEAGQTYLICSTMPSNGQTVSNYQHCADIFNKSAEVANKSNLTFGYHNHEYEFEQENGKVLYDILLTHTDPAKVKFELDLGWLIVSGQDATTYFNKFPGRFPLWHLKDMDKTAKHSTEFGKGDIDLKALLAQAKKAGMKNYFVEQEEYSMAPLVAVQYDLAYLKKL
ncbi:MAG: sugar phosphate isomerase/epimerase family protein [Mucilaginibacter sp.]|uniref:sugar phosphate isomerase/epimerase family protein n=1 Tax=Mucilaginibacter sp. TaxID=1882438 RepID=UPI0034E4227D